MLIVATERTNATFRLQVEFAGFIRIKDRERIYLPSQAICTSQLIKPLNAVAMPTVTQATVSTSVDVPGTAIHTQGASWKPIKSVSPPQSVSSTSSEKKRTSKYRHVAAYHSSLRTSPLSTDSPVNPSFIGFRNLMVIVLSM